MKQHAIGALIGATLVQGSHLWLDRDTAANSPLVAKLEAQEGFRDKPYKDSRGYLTLGFGTNLDLGITRAEGRYLLIERVRANLVVLERLWPPLKDQPDNVRMALELMAYQLGPAGVADFHDMLFSLQRKDYKAAQKAALESEWAKQTPTRAKQVSALFVEDQ